MKMTIVQPRVAANLEQIADFDELLQAGEDSFEQCLIKDYVVESSGVNSVSIADSRIEESRFVRAEFLTLGMKDVQVARCDMTMANFANASWHMVAVESSRCSGMQLDTSSLKNVRFHGCKLDMVNFRFAELVNVEFEDCVIPEMDFYGATLKNVRFINCEIDRIELGASQLRNVDFTQAHIIHVKKAADLKGALISDEQLVQLAPYLAASQGIKVESLR